ncbi:PEP/pyruvate-binding domain-containing protein [Ruminococcus sp. OA3]|uniref:PEP/pyruvate-binding domain-containing protein n=1 Tax=Ruminococcus sp. OA3 TaxID=2914164 RepID=UPI001F0527D3|nr:PEP/pyruvate-binding domain-containing protein [Ruminococcus sp. OA3]MCH1981924.1 PEP/pyruvate-binding domain-containing protein [Ruminococcus sp. OA3]
MSSATEDINGLLLCDECFTNIVWQVTEQTEFWQALSGLLATAAEEGKKILYIRFSEKPVLPEIPDQVTTVDIPLTHQFETFTADVYRTIRHQKEKMLFILDPLSELQAAWNTDLMMKNFFCVISSAVQQKKGMAFYVLTRGRHSSRTISEIRRMTDVMLDLYSDFRYLYLRPQKTGKYTSGTIFMPHIYDTEKRRFFPVRDGILASHFQRALNLGSGRGHTRNIDSWDRFFENTRRDFESGQEITEACGRMCRIMMSRDPHMQKLIRKNYKPEDYFFVSEHMIGTGLIGGKACGMLTARKLIENKRPDIYEKLEPHDSFFIGADIFYSYIVENHLWELHMCQKNPEHYFELGDRLAEGLKHGSFSRDFEEEICRMLEYYGQSPVIVRSSSLLEDGFGNAFAGKYESVFCANVGSMEERLQEFEDAIRVVYASTMSRSALDYRLRRGLDQKDEQMALLVQRVSGSHYGHYFMPCAAGVGYSFSAYRFLETLNPEAGMLRLVMGLGTAAVDRTEGSYPRLVSLDKPSAPAYKDLSDHHSHSQRIVEVIDKNTRAVERVLQNQIEDALPEYMKRILLEHDTDAERMMRERGMNRDITFISCRGIVQNTGLMKDMKEILSLLQQGYGQAVDIEFTINLSEEGEYIINLLQCRPLQAFGDQGAAGSRRVFREEEILLDCRHTSMGNSQHTVIDAIVYVDPVKYYRMPYHEKTKVARIIGDVNWHYRDREEKLLLMVPGRVGTSSPELGVPTVFSDISGFCAVFELAESKAGYQPELSYGSHIFQDLVENEILYTAVFEDKRTVVFHPERLAALKNHIFKIVPGIGGCEDIVSLYLPGTSKCKCTLYHDMSCERTVLYMDTSGSP